MSRPTAPATLHKHEGFHSSHLAHDRDMVVYLPPDYGDPAATRRYPVLYMHDGQNLFDPDTAFVKGEHWRVGETATALIEAGRLAPLIIVGIYNTGPERINEYTHSYDRRRGGGEADAYGRLLVEELKPFIDATYRTLPDRENTGLGGSSLGALVTLYLGLMHPKVFSRLAVMSPSVWWDRRSILREVRRGKPEARPRIWLDMGTHESQGAGSARRVLEDVRLLKAGLIKAGWVEGTDLHYEEVEGASHGERAWGDRFGRVAEYLFPLAIRPLTS
jgi:predicted alpha/beta superfamily hydrolase